MASPVCARETPLSGARLDREACQRESSRCVMTLYGIPVHRWCASGALFRRPARGACLAVGIPGL